MNDLQLTPEEIAELRKMLQPVPVGPGENGTTKMIPLWLALVDNAQRQAFFSKLRESNR